MSMFNSSQTGTHDQEDNAPISRPGTLVPLTVRQVLSATIQEKNVFVNGKLSELVKIVARVLHKSEDSAPFLTVSDGTGVLRVKTLLRDSTDKMIFQNIQRGQYLRFFGQISPFSTERQFIAHSLSPIESDYNEIIQHMISAIWTLLVQQGRIDPTPPPTAEQPKQQNVQQNNPMPMQTESMKVEPSFGVHDLQNNMPSVGVVPH